MSFNISLTGIAAAQADLDATSNNIANVGTIGFKQSRVEFESVYANSLFSNSKTKVGEGVSVAAVSQQFTQGSRVSTENPLDLAINGDGFFATSPVPGEQNFSYTRAGNFKLNDNNYIVDNNGNYLQVFPVNEDGTSKSVSLSTCEAVKIPEQAGTPVATSKVDLSFNLDSREAAHNLADFDPENAKTYNDVTTVQIYDSLGTTHQMSTYYVKPENAAYTDTNQWVTFITVDGKPVDVWDTAGGTGQIAGSYAKDINNDGEADSLANLDAAVTSSKAKATVASTTASTSAATAAISAATAAASAATAATDAATAAADATALAADPTDPALIAAAAASAAQSSASNAQAATDDAQASADKAQAAIDAAQEVNAIKARDEAVAALNLATANGVDGSAVYTDAEGNTHTGAVLTFDSSGRFTGSSPASVTLQALGFDDPSSAAAMDGAGVLDGGVDGTQSLTLNYNEPTAQTVKFEPKGSSQDGLTVGRITGVEIDTDGIIKANYSNGASQPLGRVALVRFRNEQGLEQKGSSWIATQNSGEPIAGEADSGSFGMIESAKVEQSNVNLTQELVDLISAQRNFQASSRGLEVSNTLQDTILQIR